jgi:hypothetical protein
VLNSVRRALQQLDFGLGLALAVVAGAALYTVAYLDPYIALFMAPFFALGCARGKHPLILLALSLVPALLLLAASAVKVALTGVPLVSYDQYFLRQNVLMLAYNDWRVAIALVVTLAGTLLYIRHLFAGRGPFSRFERWSLAALAFACSGALIGAQRWDQNLFDWEKELGTPSLRTLVMSAQIPQPQLHLLPEPGPAPLAASTPLGAPVGPLPDIFIVLQESTFPPALLRPGYEPQALFAKTAPSTGPLHVHTFAGATWKTEFAVTTQMRPQEFGGDGLYVFHQLEGRIKRSIFTELKALGYRTMVFYPVPANFINARSFYTSIGVDEFYDPESLGISTGWTWNISDAALYEAMLKKIGSSQTPVVAMLLTINQHGPHNAEDPLTDYMARFAASDRAYGEFLGALSSRGRPAGVVAFGDHQPDFTARYLEDHYAWSFTAYDIRCVNFACAPVSERRGRPLDVVLLAPLALEKFGFTLDGLSVLERSLFQGCDDDITHCDESVRMSFNGAFSRFVD